VIARLRVLLPAVALTAALAGCSPSAPSLPAGPLTVGLVTSLTGIELGLGVDLRLGALQAVDEVNARGGVQGHQVRLAVVDDRSTAAGGAAVYPALLKEKAAGILGPLDPDSAAAVVAAAATRHTPLVLAGGADPLVSASPNAFLAAPAASRAAQRMLAYAASAHLARLAVAHPASGDAYADAGVKELVAGAAKAGLTLVDQTFDPGLTDFTAAVAAVRGSGAQALLVWGGGSGPPILERMWAAAGPGIPILLSPESATTAFLRAVADAGEGALIVTTQSVLAPALPAGSAVHRQVDGIAAAFQRANGYYPTQSAFDGYGAARLLLAAIDSAGSIDPNRVDAALTHLRLSTAAGPYTFTAHDHLGLPESWIVVAKVSGGKLGPA
jgi:branched-chain amino acid transport system substrate-binding protein